MPRHICFVFIALSLMSFSFFTSSSKAQTKMSPQEIKELLEFTAFAKHFTSMCRMLPDFYGSYFTANYTFLRDQMQLEYLSEDSEMTSRQARSLVDGIISDVIVDTRLLVQAVGCEGKERDVFLDHYNEIANTPTEELAQRIYSAGTPVQ